MKLVWQFVKKPQSLTDRLRLRHHIVDAILTTLQKAPEPMTVQEICDETGYSYNSIYKTIYELARTSEAVRHALITGRKTLDIESLDQFPSVRHWLSALKKGPSRKTAKYTFYHFVKFMKNNSEFKSPDELIENALDASRRGLGNHTALIKSFIASLPRDSGLSTLQKRYNTIRSFYLHNDCELPTSRLNLDTDDSSSNVTIPDIDREQEEALNYLALVKKAATCSKATPMWKAIVMCKTQGFLDGSTLANVFNHVAFWQLCRAFGTEDYTQWSLDRCPVRVDLVRPKAKNRKFYTLLDRDAVMCLKDWLVVRQNIIGGEIKIYERNTRQDKIPISDPIFITSQRKAISPDYCSMVFRELGKASGINEQPVEKTERFRGAKRRYPFHAHEVRDAGRSLAATLDAENEAEFFMGHPIDKLRYDKHPFKFPDYTREKYSRMSPFLNVLSVDPEKSDLREQLKVQKKRADDAEVNLSARLLVTQKMLEEVTARLEKAKESEKELANIKLILRLKQDFDTETIPERKHILGEKLKKLMEY